MADKLKGKTLRGAVADIARDLERATHGAQVLRDVLETDPAELVNQNIALRKALAAWIGVAVQRGVTVPDDEVLGAAHDALAGSLAEVGGIGGVIELTRAALGLDQ
jgi:hypothetical protein